MRCSTAHSALLPAASTRQYVQKSLPNCQETSDNANANRNPLVVSRVRKQSQTDDFYARKGYRSKTSRTRWCTSRTWWLGRFPAGERCAWSGRRKPCVERREERRGGGLMLSAMFLYTVISSHFFKFHNIYHCLVSALLSMSNSVHTAKTSASH